ncbi:MAG: crossover junction endodeoxyribonuclease RuvC [Proteobacteria bacterium]|nr:crossover junction endodeoxyribonuclease RuvC [Pseudomonadota bacterium]MDA0993487.1 crossover junction endodeoxyribonuclease RuvC [Pseudomonadota bacterium]
MTDRQRILGIDPGSRLTGFGILDCEGDRSIYVASGSVNSVKGDFPERLKLIFRSISEIVAKYRPDVVAIESVFMQKNAGSALKLGHARSAAICATFEMEISVFEYAPREIKQAVVGTGAATKEQIQHMIRQMLQLDGDPSPDAADALAAALCHANQRRLNRVLKTAAAANLK